MTGSDHAGSEQSGSGQADPDRADPGDAAAKKAAKDKARIDAVFGQTLPETTSDEVRESDSRIDDVWWREQRPPHHG